MANSLVTVVLDPGHGGSDSGSIAVDGTFEKDLNLKIAEFCKNELEQYQNVRALMTRTDDYYVKLEDRSKIAHDNNANLFVSIHCNYSGNTTAKGAEIYYPNNSNYNHYTHDEGKKAAQNILNQLTELGIKNRGIKNRDADQYFEPYPDNEISDYYSVIRNCRKYGVTGILVEHAFLSNRDDYYSYLYGDDKLENLGIADATGIANYFNLDKDDDVDLADGTYVISPVSNRENVVDIKDKSLEEGKLAYLNKEYESNNAQKFQVTRSGNTYKIKNLNSNMNLSIDNDNIRQATDNDSDPNQKWKLSKVRDANCYYLKNAGNLKYMTAKDSDLNTSDAMFDDTQQFLFIPVSSDKIKNGKYMLCNRNNVEQILDISQGSKEDNTNCQIHHENQSDAQYFDLIYQDGYYIIKNTNSGKVLDVSGAGLNNNTNIAQYSFNSSTAQKWSLIDNDDGTFSFISRCNALSIDCAGGSTADNTNIASYYPNRTNAQKFILFDHSNCDISIENGIYAITSNSDNSYALDVNGASFNNGDNIQIWTNNDSLAQRYKFEKIENGYYKIIAQCSEKSLYVEDGKTENGTKLKQWDYDSLAAQKWMLEKNNDGSYSIVSRCNGKYLDIAGNLVESGTNIV
ncbi:MAG: RICIN domain-containing protein, partial [Oscillospiraceae bacterium]|nr:RICIN domain-containing protein [Oscillospiraceae bacterium]